MKTLQSVADDAFPDDRKDQRRLKPGPTAGFRRRQMELTKVLMEHHHSSDVIHKIFEAAMDDKHKNQGVAWKLLIDRQIPVDALEKSKGSSQVNVVISGLQPKGVMIDGKAETDAD